MTDNEKYDKKGSVQLTGPVLFSVPNSRLEKNPAAQTDKSLKIFRIGYIMVTSNTK